jgi:Cu/Zn superoxide dismutase
MKTLKIALGVLAITGFAATGAQAAMVKYKANLTAAAEVPPTTSTGKGMAEMTLDTATKELTWKVTYEGLTGDALAAHIHGPADAGANGGVEVNIGAGGMKNPLEGKATLTDAQIADINAGKTYVNIHTAANKGGEIRGQVGK